MTTALKNRLVGTIIIVALAVIFLPDILDGKKQTTQDLFVDLPEQPETKSVQSVPNFPTEQIKQETQTKVEVVPDVATDDFDIDDQANTLSGEASSEINNDELAVVQKDQIDAQQVTNQSAEVIDRKISDPATEQSDETQKIVNNSLNESLLEEAGWVVQLGVFRHQKNVRELLSQLRNEGYRAFSRPVQTSSGELTKVFVGPDLEKESLEKALPHLRSLTKLQGRITPFTVK
ncbi:SPOR domain-containing protein [Aliiglaciecola sp.]|nr:SPOR domain-containing protein [Aliiglaciecola sp.]